MGEKTQNTNLASEFYILSMMYRMGINGQMTLGNKKAVDIVVEKGAKFLTIDVKGLMGTTSFPIDNCKKREKTHFLIFVSFLNKMDDPSCLPEVYIVPSNELDDKHKELEGKTLVYNNPQKNRTVVQLNRLRKLKNKYKDKWNYFE